MSLPPPTAHNRAIVTGASSGIGAALAERLAARGYSLIIIARREDRLHTLAQQLGARHRVAVDVRPCDLADRSSRAELIEELAGHDVAVLANNAGFATYGPLANANTDRERNQVELDVVAVHDLTLAVLPGMLARRAGAILVTGSTAGNQPGPNNATYAGSKAFANTFAESLHYELKGTGVACTLLAPGPVRTEFAQVAELSALDRLVPAPLWVTADHAAEAAMVGLARGKRRVVPGPFAKAQTLGGQYGPRGVSGPVLRAVYERAQ